MTMQALQKIRDEHRTLSAVLHALKQLARDAQNAGVQPRFDVFRAMLRYIDEFPEKLHHPKEDQHLFARLINRYPDAAHLVAQLQDEHLAGARLVRELERSLMFFEDTWPGGAPEFLEKVDAYADFHWKHMRKEEQEVLPLTEKHLTAEDWKKIDAAFDANLDPIEGIRERDFQELFSRIVCLSPAPVGVGEPWKKRSA
jgi:hemerythrin-like domain-containing protein